MKSNNFFSTIRAIVRLSSHDAATWQLRAEQKRDKTFPKQKHPKCRKVRCSECIAVRHTYARHCIPSRQRVPRSWWWGGRGWWGWGRSRRWTPPPPSPQQRTRTRPPSLRTQSSPWTVHYVLTHEQFLNEITMDRTVLLHNGGFCNNRTPKTMLAHISAFPNKCTIKHPFHTTAIHEKYGNLWKFHNSVMFSTILYELIAMHGILPKVV